MSAKEYTNSVYHKTGVEAARKKRIYTAFISEESTGGSAEIGRQKIEKN